MTNRRWGLDLLRAIAILVVIEQHGRFISEKLGSKLSNLGVTDGVDLFFVLSGFLIGNILIRDYSQNQRLDIKKFWLRRWLRTVPIYLVALLINVFFTLLFFKADYGSKDMLAHFFFVQNIIPPYTDFRFFSEAWSLSIEEFFYLTLPTLILTITFVTRRRETDIVFVLSLIGMALFSIGCRFLLYHRLPYDAFSLTEWNTRFRIVVPTRLDSLAVGVFGALMRWKFPSLWNNRKFKLSSFSLGLLLMIALDRTQILNGRIPLGFFAFVPYFLSYPIAVAMTLPFLDTWQPRANLFTRGITTVSKLSYSMYLFHNSLIAVPLKSYAISLTREYEKLGMYLLYWALVIIISYFAYTYIERPILRYRDQNYP